MPTKQRKTKERVVKAFVAINPTKYDHRYKDNWFDVADFRIDHKTSLFLKKSHAQSFIENRVDWIVLSCTITYKLPSKK